MRIVSTFAAVALCLVALPAVAHASTSSLPSKSQWEADVATATKPLQPYLQQRLPQGSHLAIVLDIDNTSLATHYDPGQPVKPVLDAANYAHAHGAAILFASYRKTSDRDATLKQLKAAGYTVDKLCLRAKDSATKAEVKLSCREGFESDGYTLVANIGNNDTDFQGGHYEKGFELPNYNGQLS
jgi:predicted secreted acid phosphatase